MRLTLIGPVYPYRGGIAHYTGLLSRALRQHNHEIQLISFQRQYPGWLYPGKTDREPGKPIVDLAAQYTLDPLYPWTWSRTSRTILDYQPQAVIIQWWTTFWAPAFSRLATALRKSNIPVIFIIHNVMPHEVKRWDTWLANLALSRGDRFIVQSNREEKRLRALLPKAEIQTCPLPVFDLNQSKGLSRGAAIEQIDLDPAGPILLCFGIVRPYKGLQYAIQAVAGLEELGQTYHLLVAGEIWEDKQLYVDLVHQLNITKQVTFEDRYIPNEEIENYFSAANVFLAPYIDGTQSAAIKLALGYGVPIVASDILADDMLTQSSRAFFVPPGDVTALSRAIESAVNLKGSMQPATNLVEESWTRLVRTIEGMVSNLDRRR